MSNDIFVVIEHLRGQVSEISYLMLAAARQLAAETGGTVVAALLGHQIQTLATDLAAERVLLVDDPALADFTSAAYLKTLAALLPQYEPRVVLLGHTTVGMDIAGSLSIRLEWPLVSQCRQLSFEPNSRLLRFNSQICGGKLMATGPLPEPVSLVTMVPGGYKPADGKGVQPPELISVAPPPLTDLRVRLVAYHDPAAGDVDISKERILIGVGRGLQNQADLELVAELAHSLGGTICASRPLVDLGWLPTTRLVGKSGKTVKPALYLALGISGAPEHVEGLAESELIIAVNTDPDAPIFNIARYGAEVDMLDLAEALTEQLQLERVG